MSKKSISIVAHRQNQPDWTLQQIASQVGASREYVRQVLSKAGLQTGAVGSRGPITLHLGHGKICAWCAKPTRRGDWARLCWPCQQAGMWWQNRAHAKVMAAVRRGDLRPVKEQRCVDCGKPAQCYDHRNYRHALMVEAVCTRCNILRGHSSKPF